MLEYATGVINVLEKNIFDKQDQERMLNSPNKEDAFKVLFDTDMAEFLEGEKDIEKIFENDLTKTKKVLFEMLKDTKEELFYFLFLRFDAHNLKVVLKEKDYPFLSFSIVDFEKIKKNINGNMGNEYVEEMITWVISNLKKFSVDDAVDIALLKAKLKLAKKIKGLPLKIIKVEIDVANLKNFIKEKNIFLSGGNLSKGDVLRILGKEKGFTSKGLEIFLEIFNLSILIKDFEKFGSEKVLEKDFEKFLAEKVLQKERESQGGIEKIMGFFYKKVNAHSNIRLILFQKDSGVSLKEIEDNFLPI